MMATEDEGGELADARHRIAMLEASLRLCMHSALQAANDLYLSQSRAEPETRKASASRALHHILIIAEEGRQKLWSTTE